MHTATSATPPNVWAGGSWTLVPGAGVGRLVDDGRPRVIEIDLPVPACAAFIVDGPDGPRAVVLVDPRVPAARRAQVLDEARRLEQAPAVPLLRLLPGGRQDTIDTPTAPYGMQAIG